MHFLNRRPVSYLTSTFLLLAVVYSTLSLAASDQTLTEANNLIRKGDFKAAYQLLEPLEAERAGRKRQPDARRICTRAGVGN